MKIKTYGIVVTFMPSEVHLDNLTRMSEQVDNLLIVDNSPVKINIELDKATYLFNGNKGGIAGALNQGLKCILENESDALIFLFDQDSNLPENFVNNQVEFLKKHNAKCVAPRYYDVNSKTFGNYTTLNKFSIKNIYGEQLSEPTYVTFAITSGSLFSLDVIKEAGFMLESFFIDHVDSEFSVRLKDRGFGYLINPDVVFNHSIGERKLKRFLGINFKPNFHNPTRRYYAVRNAVFMLKIWGRKYPSLFWLLLLRNVYEFLGIVLFEDNRLNKFKALLLGISDGIRNIDGESKHKI